MGNHPSSSELEEQEAHGHHHLSKPDLSTISDNPEFRLKWGRLSNDEGGDDDDDGIALSTDQGPTSATTTLKVYQLHDFSNQRLLGEGGFGKVLRGRLQGKLMAVKIFNVPLVMEEALAEIGPLMKLRHRNLASIRGFVIRSNFLDADVVAIGSLMVLLDFFPEGSLLKYLSNKENPQDYAMLGKLALDIIHGCQYLHGKGIVHGNLAARNILVERAQSKQKKVHYNAKVADYGTSGLVKGSGGNYLTIEPGKVLPIRWVPKELVVDDDTRTGFSFASDVWSFGVILWEMWTKGAVPYGVSYTNMEVLDFLKAGKSPLAIHRPFGCPKHIVSEMIKIFKTDPRDRPTFRLLEEDFENLRQVSKEMEAKSSKSGKRANGSESRGGDSNSDPASCTIRRTNQSGQWKSFYVDTSPSKSMPLIGAKRNIQRKERGKIDLTAKLPVKRNLRRQRGGRGSIRQLKRQTRGPFPLASQNSKKKIVESPGAPPPYSSSALVPNPEYVRARSGPKRDSPPKSYVPHNMGYGIPPPDFQASAISRRPRSVGGCCHCLQYCCRCRNRSYNEERYYRWDRQYD